MNNETIIKYSRNKIKRLLYKCTEAEQLRFKRMYSHKNLEASINHVVEHMDSSKLDWALTQIENTLKKK